MADSAIADKARFDQIRYAQLWEDADVLLLGLGSAPGATLVSICSAGDNALAMLTLDPERVVVVDLSPAQIACLRMRMAMYRLLSNAEFLELMGSHPSARRGELLNRAAQTLGGVDQAFWGLRKTDIVAHGLGGIGKFERYFRIMRRYLLPLAQSRATIDAVFQPRERLARQAFVAEHWNNWRWRLLLRFFFSNFVMGWLGRDPAFFDQVEGSLAAHVARRIDHAAIDLDPSQNPYLHWILKGTHGEALPLSWRPEHFETIGARLDRLDIRPGSLERFVATGEKADGFNLSDIFEYMDADTFAAVYGSVLSAAKLGARLVYWNMMVPRRAPEVFASRVNRLVEVEERGKATDKAFFYSDFVVEQIIGEAVR
jgi:S-adenosylmethionine-diacylglycerol 3-amino-3-carboxypropyl transferase